VSGTVVVVVVVVGATVVVVASGAVVVDDVDGIGRIPSDDEHPEANQTMVAKLAIPIAAMPNGRRTDSP
jgi:hypothetical protein